MVKDSYYNDDLIDMDLVNDLPKFNYKKNQKKNNKVFFDNNNSLELNNSVISDGFYDQSSEYINYDIADKLKNDNISSIDTYDLISIIDPNKNNLDSEIPINIMASSDSNDDNDSSKTSTEKTLSELIDYIDKQSDEEDDKTSSQQSSNNTYSENSLESIENSSVQSGDRILSSINRMLQGSDDTSSTSTVSSVLMVQDSKKHELKLYGYQAQVEDNGLKNIKEGLITMDNDKTKIKIAENGKMLLDSQIKTKDLIEDIESVQKDGDYASFLERIQDHSVTSTSDESSKSIPSVSSVNTDGSSTSISRESDGITINIEHKDK